MNRQFIPDGRNNGGRKQIERLQDKHLLALINSTAQINVKPPKPHVDSNRPYSARRVNKQDYGEIVETYRRVKALKSGYADTSEPKTFHLRNTLWRKNKVSEEVSTQEHVNNVKSLINNINHIHQRVHKNIHIIKQNSKIHSVAATLKDQSRILRKEWDNRSSHPLEYEWKAKRPKSAITRSNGGDTLISNLFSGDSSNASRRIPQNKQMHDAIDHTSALSMDINVEDEDFIIKDTPTPQQYKQQALHPVEQSQQQIYDKHTKNYKNINIPLVKPNEQLVSIKRKIYQTLMDYKLFTRDQIYQVGVAFVNQNNWLDEEDIMNECNKISKQLYGVE